MEERRIIWSPSAIQMLWSIHEYIAETNLSNADKFVDDILSFVQPLALFPQMFALCQNKILAQKSYHCAVFQKSYTIIYKIQDSEVYILAVVHNSRNPKDIEDLT